MSSRRSPRPSRSRSSAPANTVQVLLTFTTCWAPQGQRSELVQAEVQLVGDVAEVAPAARRAAIVHLEAGHHAVLVDLDGLGVLPADVEHRARAGEHRCAPRPWQRISLFTACLGKGRVCRP